MDIISSNKELIYILVMEFITLGIIIIFSVMVTNAESKIVDSLFELVKQGKIDERTYFDICDLFLTRTAKEYAYYKISCFKEEKDE